MFRTVSLSIIRGFSLYTQQWYMSYRFAESLWAVPTWCCSHAVSKPVRVWHIPLLCVQWKPPDNGQRNCPKLMEFYSKNKFEKWVHLVGFIIRISKRYLKNTLKVEAEISSKRKLVITNRHGDLSKETCTPAISRNPWKSFGSASKTVWKEEIKDNKI